MKIFVNKSLKNSKNLPEIIKSIKKTENNHKNSFFDLGRNPMEIVHGPFYFKNSIRFIENYQKNRSDVLLETQVLANVYFPMKPLGSSNLTQVS